MPKYIVKRGEVQASARDAHNSRTVTFPMLAELIGTKRGVPASADELHLIIMGEAEQVLFDADIDPTDLAYEVRLDLEAVREFINSGG